jgi:hypothetical protein
VNTQPPINASKKRSQAIPSSHFITFEILVDPFSHCTTNVLLEYCPDDHLAKSPHPLRIPMVWHDVVVVDELVMTDCAYSVLFPDLLL